MVAWIRVVYLRSFVGRVLIEVYNNQYCDVLCYILPPVLNSQWHSHLAPANDALQSHTHENTRLSNDLSMPQSFI